MIIRVPFSGGSETKASIIIVGETNDINYTQQDLDEVAESVAAAIYAYSSTEMSIKITEKLQKITKQHDNLLRNGMLGKSYIENLQRLATKYEVRDSNE